MASDYAAIRAENERRYGTDIGRIGPMLMAERYDERTHFIFELIQNAEDALARRAGCLGSRQVQFNLSSTELRVTHCGEPFDNRHVRGICGILESTKDLTAIGRFGIGFKSVYAFTDRPEIHSGDEDFAIESFVWPVAVPTIERSVAETVIVIPLKASDGVDHEEIAAGLQRLGASTLLFLRHIEEINWSVQGKRSGLYLRESKETEAPVRRITVIGQEHGAADIEEGWLVFSRPVSTVGGLVGYVEIAFRIAKNNGSLRETILRVKRSPLVVFFPTVLETHLGFVVQGPYRTTPSRDNVPRNDAWNQNLVRETASLLVEALRWLRDHEQLDTMTLRCLPLDSTKFGETDMFAPLYAATKEALSSEPLLPRFDAGYVPAACARLARTQELRELLTPRQLAAILGEEEELIWLSGDITQDRTPELRQYLMRELGIAEMTPEMLIPRLEKRFLEAQPDTWILDLYLFLDGQPALRRRLDDLPLIRLEDGTHVVTHIDGQPQAFLPGEIKTGFPTVRPSVCGSETARKFLRALGLTEPDVLDDVICYVLPKYRNEDAGVADPEYEADIARILEAFDTDSKGQRDKLLAALRETPFVMAVDAVDGSKRVSKPGEVYLATERLKELFAGVADVFFVDDSYACLRGEAVRELLEACGASRYLQPIPAETPLTWEERREIRRNAGLEQSGRESPITDSTLRGLATLLDLLPRLGPDVRRHRTELLWEALTDVENRRGSRAFSGEYTWSFHRTSKTAGFDAAFVRQLNDAAWVPDANGELQRPEFVDFDKLDWKPNPFLQSKIRFKPSIIDALAKEAGIEPGVLDLLKKHGLTSVADLRSKLGLSETEPPPPKPDLGSQNVDDTPKALLGRDAPAPTPSVPALSGTEPQGSKGTGLRRRDDGADRDAGRGGGEAHGVGAARSGGKSDAMTGDVKRIERSPGQRLFISYVGAHPDDEGPEPDGLDQQARMALEEKALSYICAREPELKRTPMYNPGFDLFEVGNDDQPARWVEVKAMTGSWRDRSVGLSRAQFECAREHAGAYWLYVVENAGDDRPRIVRIQDPAGKARTFTFDCGWLCVAEVDGASHATTEAEDCEE